MERTVSFKTKSVCVLATFLWNAKLGLKKKKKRKKMIAIVREIKLQNTQYCKVGYFPSQKAEAGTTTFII